MFTFEFTTQSILIALLIFTVRVISTSLDTVRVILTMRSNKFWVWVLGFFNSAIWVLTFAFVLADIDNIVNCDRLCCRFCHRQCGWYVD